MFTWTKSLLLTSLILLQPTNAARSIAARRARPTPTSPDRYDRSITTFSPEGRLLQLEYALIAAEERGWGMTVCVEWEGVVVFAFPSADSGSLSLSSEHEVDDTKLREATTTLRMECNPLHNTKIHRLSPTHLLLTSGLAGDSRTLASAFRRLIASWTQIQYGESVSVREVAREVGIVRHGIGLRPGARVLGVVGVLIGLEDVYYDDETKNRVEVRMYKSLPGGTIDRCNLCCTGGGADSLGRRARKETMESLSQFLSQSSGDLTSSEDTDQLEGNDISLEKIIEEVGKAALKHHPHSNLADGDIRDDDNGNITKKKAAVDIWVVRAAPKPDQSSSEHQLAKNNEMARSEELMTNSPDNIPQTRHLGPSFSCPHRHLGCASIDLRYASRVSLEQLPEALKCLVT